MLLMDEPTNHLDMETIDSLAEAINNFEGGLVLVSHDFRLINQVCTCISFGYFKKFREITQIHEFVCFHEILYMYLFWILHPTT